jgi:hypothetical protein
MTFRKRFEAIVASIAVGCGAGSSEPSAVNSAAFLEDPPCGAQVSRRGNTLQVSPSGTEDTDAIQCALDHAQGGTVRLAPGVFRVAQIVANGFVGRLVGAGADRTTVTNVDRPLPVIAVDWSLAPPSADHPWPTLLAFVDGSFLISDVAIHVTGTEPTTGWSAFGIQVKAMAHAISLTGTTAAAVIERVDVRGEDAPGDLFGLNLINAIDVEGITGTDPPPLAVRLAVRDSVFAHLASGVPVANLRFADVSITGNRFDGTYLAAEIIDVADTSYRFADNDASTAWATIDQYDVRLGPSAVFGVERTSLQIADNRISGGPVAFEGTLGEDVRCRVVDNTFEGTPGFDVFLGPGTHGCLVNGTADVVDLGTGNRVVP